MSAKLSIGYSPCPNDTFIFYALSHGLIGAGIEFEDEILADVETLNSWAMQARLDVTKLSLHALGHVLDKYVLLDSGSALGHGCGPLLISTEEKDIRDLKDKKIAIPGRYTTAAMLIRLFAPDCLNFVEMRFDKIMAAVKSGAVAAGVIIHESRFTYQQEGLHKIKDLGSWWEQTSGHPIPLGGIVARRSLGAEKIKALDLMLKKSIAWAFANREQAWGYIKKNAQEIDTATINAHIDLYVNSFSSSLGGQGRAAVLDFLARGEKSGILPDFGQLELFSP